MINRIRIKRAPFLPRGRYRKADVAGVANSVDVTHTHLSIDGSIQGLTCIQPASSPSGRPHRSSRSCRSSRSSRFDPAMENDGQNLPFQGKTFQQQKKKQKNARQLPPPPPPAPSSGRGVNPVAAGPSGATGVCGWWLSGSHRPVIFL